MGLVVFLVMYGLPMEAVSFHIRQVTSNPTYSLFPRRRIMVFVSNDLGVSSCAKRLTVSVHYPPFGQVSCGLKLIGLLNYVPFDIGSSNTRIIIILWDEISRAQNKLRTALPDGILPYYLCGGKEQDLIGPNAKPLRNYSQTDEDVSSVSKDNKLSQLNVYLLLT